MKTLFVILLSAISLVSVPSFAMTYSCGGVVRSQDRVVPIKVSLVHDVSGQPTPISISLNGYEHKGMAKHEFRQYQFSVKSELSSVTDYYDTLDGTISLLLKPKVEFAIGGIQLDIEKFDISGALQCDELP